MKSLAAVCVSETIGGGELYLLRLLSALQSVGWRVVVVGTMGSPVQEATETHGLDFIGGQLGPKLGRSSALRNAMTFPRQRRELLRLLGQADCQLVLLQYKLEQLLIGGRTEGRVLAMLEHGPIPWQILTLPIVQRAYVRSLSSASICFAASKPAEADLTRLGFTSVYLPAGVDTLGPTFPPPGRRRALFAGRLEESKGVVTAINLVLRSNQYHLTIAGSGPLARTVAALADAHPTRVTFVGQVGDVDALIQSCDLGILLTSDPGEGRPLFVLECLARGRPVVGLSSSPAMRALAEELPNGSVVLLDKQNIETARLPTAVGKVQPQATSWRMTADAFAQAVASIPR